MYKKIMSVAIAVFMFTMLCVPVSAANSGDMSAEIPYNNIYGYDYYTFTMLNAGGNTAYGTAFLVSRNSKTMEYTTVPAYYMGVQSRIVNQSGGVVAESPMRYNENPYYFVEISTGTVPSTGLVRAGGTIAIYNGSDYTTINAPFTPYANSSSKSSISSDELNETETFTYPQNSSGQTYGSCLYAEQAGGDPDLISAVGVGGVEGYIKSDDVTPKVNNPMEAMEYMVNFNSNRVIPLYDREGVRIGSFVLEAMEEEVVNGARQALLEMKAELALAS